MLNHQDNIGNYIIERMIGKGAMASVYLCRDPQHTWVALKILDSTHPSVIKRFEREIALLASLSHPNIVRYIHHGYYKGMPFLVMEYIDGIDLKLYTQKLHQRPPFERYARCREFGFQISQALSYIHTKNIIHRDIKPSNILIRDDQVVLIDFGTIKQEEVDFEKTQLGQLIGTPSYASPEQIYGGELSPQSDQFSLGATLYHMITKKRPFDSIDRNHKVRPPSQFDPNIPPQLEATILRMMAMDPNSRFPSTEELEQALSKKQRLGIPLAGRQDVLDQIQHILHEAQHLGKVIVRPVGVFGSGKSWASKTLHNGANKRDIPVFEVINSLTAQAATTRLQDDQPLLVIDRFGMQAPAGISLLPLKISALRLADIRRSVYAHAPKTQDLAKQSDLLHRLSGGIPALLLPLLKTYTIEQQLLLSPNVDPPPIIHDFFHNLELDDLESLGSVALIKRPCSAAEIEQVSMIPANDILPKLKNRGLLNEIKPDVWMISAGLFEKHIFTLLPDIDSLQQRINKLFSLLDQTELITRIRHTEKLCAEGKLSEARCLAQENHKLSMGYDSALPRCHALICLGMVYLDLGLFDKAKMYFADASALSKALNQPILKEESHLYRARIDLELRPGSRTAISSAIDRLSSLITTSDNLHTHAMWTWALAALGDNIRWRKSLEMIKSKVSQEEPIFAGRILFCLLRAACCIGDQKEAREIIIFARPFIEHLLLFEWEFGRAEALLTQTPPPPTSPLAYGLTPQELQALKNRWIYAKGISPDPTWTN